MCTYSMVVDWGIEKLNPWYPQIPNTPPTINPNFTPKIEYVPSEEWRKQFLNDLLDLLKRAKQYDTDNGEPDCELESKKEKLKAIADELGVEISFP